MKSIVTHAPGSMTVVFNFRWKYPMESYGTYLGSDLI